MFAGRLFPVFKFRARYKTHKVPVRSLFEGNLLKKARAAGSLVTVPREVEERLLREKAADEGDLVDEIAAAECNVGATPGNALKRRRRPTLNKEMDVEVVEDDSDGISTRFVNLVDLIPPLPKKGDFEVSVIKDSQYFFS